MAIRLECWSWRIPKPPVLLFMMGGALLATSGCITTPQEWFSRAWEKHRDEKLAAEIDTPHERDARATAKAGEKLKKTPSKGAIVRNEPAAKPKSNATREAPAKSDALAAADSKRAPRSRPAAAAEADDVGIVQISDHDEAAPEAPVEQAASRTRLFKSNPSYASDPFLAAERERPAAAQPAAPQAHDSQQGVNSNALPDDAELERLKSVFEGVGDATGQTDNPFASLAARPTKPAPQAARRAAPAPAERDLGDPRLQADALMYRARLALKRNLPEDAYRLAQAAEKIEVQRKVPYGPQEERPSDFVKRLERLRPAVVDAATDSTSSAAASKSIGADPAHTRAAEAYAVKKADASLAANRESSGRLELVSRVSANRPLAIPPLVVGPSETPVMRSESAPPTVGFTPAFSTAPAAPAPRAEPEPVATHAALASPSPVEPARPAWNVLANDNPFARPRPDEQPAELDGPQLSANRVQPIPTDDPANPFEAPLSEGAAPPPPAQLPPLPPTTSTFVDPFEEQLADSGTAKVESVTEKKNSTLPMIVGFSVGLGGLCGFGVWRRLQARHYTPRA